MASNPLPEHPLYEFVNLLVRSVMPLPELAMASPHALTDGDQREVIDVVCGPLPETLPDARTIAHGLQVAGDSVLLTVEATARYLVRGGREIVIDPIPGGSERNLRLFLLGSALGILCHQRGLLPLHANAIVVDGQAIAFAGHSGAGKSTLAAHFERAGYEVLCDDVCALSFDADGLPSAWPGLPRLKLWGDAAEAFGHRRDDLDQAIEGMDKYHVPLTARPRARPVPFRRLYLLRQAEDGVGGVTRLLGRDAMEAVMGQTYRAQYLEPMGLRARHFALCAALLSRVEVFAASRVWGYDVFDTEARRLERHVLNGS